MLLLFRTVKGCLSTDLYKLVIVYNLNVYELTLTPLESHHWRNYRNNFGMLLFYQHWDTSVLLAPSSIVNVILGKISTKHTHKAILNYALWWKGVYFPLKKPKNLRLPRTSVAIHSGFRAEASSDCFICVSSAVLITFSQTKLSISVPGNGNSTWSSVKDKQFLKMI